MPQPLELTAEEREFLQSHLELVLKETRIEEHRTRSPLYRKTVIKQESQIEAILQKLRP